ncbi:uncharacterized protein LOC120683719 [Panicum virgatum]|uniref:Rx N-terminal domain-containing protein n=1 Tax=Panicum virgatum TaxID=38727 RepID=A0A8T0WFA4_PANVG|nr:uncharacterized protein LOC120683719 [Panicum virgatum]KAG2644536.1 hypothetical protein PVAP13_2KG203486 [Panicum virgatum]
MAEIVGTAVATEAVSRISSILSGDKASHEIAEGRAERLEMAVLKIRSVVAVSEDLHISHPPLLQWKAKLKRVAEEGDGLLHAQYKKQALGCDRVSDDPAAAAGTSISRYLIQAARRLAPFRRKEAELDDVTLRRFERFADGADSFFRLVESGGRPKGSMFLPSLTWSLLAGESMEFSIRRGSGGGDDLVMLWPWPDTGVEDDGLVACLAVSREDEAMWEKNLKMCVVFRLSEASDILAIAVGCLELLPPQFDAAGVALRRLLTETIGQRGDSSSLSERSRWCRRHIQSHSRNDREPSSTGDEHRGTGIGTLRPHQVLQLTAACYASPSIAGSLSCPVKAGVPLKLVYRVSPYFLPEKHSNQFELVEQDDARKLLPTVTDGFYDGRGQPAVTCGRQIWCPQSSMYCKVAPEISKPLTMAQASLMESSGAPSRRRSRGGARI